MKLRQKAYEILSNMKKLTLLIFIYLIQLMFYSKRNKYRFIANSSLSSFFIKEAAKTIFITTNGLNDAKDILINGKLFQGIGIIYISEIENWNKIKKEPHWPSVILTDSIFPIAAFGFETTDLHNLLNFEYSLVDDKGKLLQFNQGEYKISALNFTIQIIQYVKNKKKNPTTKKNQNEEAQLHDEIKNSIKNLYLSDQKKKKELTIMLNF